MTIFNFWNNNQNRGNGVFTWRPAPQSHKIQTPSVTYKPTSVGTGSTTSPRRGVIPLQIPGFSKTVNPSPLVFTMQTVSPGTSTPRAGFAYNPLNQTNRLGLNPNAAAAAWFAGMKPTSTPGVTPSTSSPLLPKGYPTYDPNRLASLLAWSRSAFGTGANQSSNGNKGGSSSPFSGGGFIPPVYGEVVTVVQGTTVQKPEDNWNLVDIVASATWQNRPYGPNLPPGENNSALGAATAFPGLLITGQSSHDPEDEQYFAQINTLYSPGTPPTSPNDPNKDNKDQKDAKVTPPSDAEVALAMVVASTLEIPIIGEVIGAYVIAQMIAGGIKADQEGKLGEYIAKSLIGLAVGWAAFGFLGDQIAGALESAGLGGEAVALGMEEPKADLPNEGLYKPDAQVPPETTDPASLGVTGRAGHMDDWDDWADESLGGFDPKKDNETLDEILVELREKILNKDDVENILDILHRRPELQGLDANQLSEIKNYLFKSRGIKFSSVNYVYWEGLNDISADVSPSTREVGAIVHEIAEIADLKAQGIKDVIELQTDQGQISAGRFVDQYYDPRAHGVGLKAEYEFYAETINQRLEAAGIKHTDWTELIEVEERRNEVGDYLKDEFSGGEISNERRTILEGLLKDLNQRPPFP